MLFGIVTVIWIVLTILIPTRLIIKGNKSTGLWLAGISMFFFILMFITRPYWQF